MKTMYRCLLVAWDGGGNVPPVADAARQLLAAGHEVWVLTEPCLQETFAGLGAKVILFSHYFTRTQRDADLIKDAHAKPWQLPVFDNVIVGPVDSVAQETLHAIHEIQPHALLADCMMFGCLFAAESQGIPRVILFHMPEYLPGPNRPPGGFGLSPGRSAIGKWRDRALTALFHRTLAKYVAPLNTARRKLSLAEISSIDEVFHNADLRLIQTAQAFDLPISPAPSNVRYTGPVLDDPDWISPTLHVFPQDQPIVLVSLSTTFQGQANCLQSIITALEKLPVHAIVTTGPAMKTQEFKCSERIRLVEGLPHSEILPHCEVVVCHAGHGTLIKALAHGVPVLAIPMGRDQNDNAQRAVEHGAGLKLGSNASVRSIRCTIQRLLNEPAFRSRASHLAQTINAQQNAFRVARSVEALLDAQTVEPPQKTKHPTRA